MTNGMAEQGKAGQSNAEPSTTVESACDAFTRASIYGRESDPVRSGELGAYRTERGNHAMDRTETFVQTMCRAPRMATDVRAGVCLRRRILLLILLIAGSWGGYEWYVRLPLVHVFHVPETFSRRQGNFTVNISGRISPLPGFIARRIVKGVRYRVNNESWRNTGQNRRVLPPFFAVELRHGELRPGRNRLLLEASVYGRPPELKVLEFTYDTTSVQLPLRVDWANARLEAEDGKWETFEVNGAWRVRPKPGFEGYDRILVVAGAFPGGRRITTDVIFRSKVDYSDDYGFGILSAWGGRPDDLDVRPRRGWSFGLTWYWSRYEGVGNEFSYKHGDGPPVWVNTYRNLQLQPGVRYFVTIECWPERDAAGRLLRHRQRAWWRPEGQTIPNEGITLADTEGAPLPIGEYGVALIAYHVQVDFGPVLIEPWNETAGEPDMSRQRAGD